MSVLNEPDINFSNESNAAHFYTSIPLIDINLSMILEIIGHNQNWMSIRNPDWMMHPISLNSRYRRVVPQNVRWISETT